MFERQSKVSRQRKMFLMENTEETKTENAATKIV